MPEQVEIEERYWGWCTWRPCRKTRVVTKWRYDFSFVVVSYRGVRTSYWGCEFNRRYEWKRWEFSGRFEDLTLYFISMYFKNRLSDKGSCSSSGVVRHLANVLGDDPAKTLREYATEQEPQRNAPQ